jgi:hypothetical protein
METSSPFSFEQPLPGPEEPGKSETLPPPVEAKKPEQAAGETVRLREAEFAKKAIEKRPEAIMAHTIAAAERGEAKEAANELRHEIKDEPVQPMVPVGSVVAEISERQPAMAKASQYTSKPATSLNPEADGLPQVQDDQKSSFFILYRRPMAAGFAAALAVLGIFIIVSLITS